MRYLSLFSGIEAASVAWRPLGWQPVAFAEIDPFACAVLAYHYPDVPNLGSVTDITDEQIAALGRVDVVVGGSPCQDLSVAGKRAGLAGERSGLFHHQLRIFNAARHLCGSRFLLWENVPGAFSTHDGRDFAVVVGSMAGLELSVPKGGWGTEGVALGENGLVEWCVLDAQWFGVAQRRRRVFALLDVGDWSNRPPILLEPESLRGDPPPRGEAGKDVAPTIAARTRGGGGLGTDFDCDGGLIPAPHDVISPALKARDSKGPSSDGAGDGDGAILVPMVAPTLQAGGNSTGGDRPPGTTVDTCDSLIVTHSLRAEGFDASEDGTGRGTPIVPVHAFDARQSDVIQYGDQSGPLDTPGHSIAVAFDTTQITSPTNRSNPQPDDPCHTLAKGSHALAIAFAHKAGGAQTTLGYDPELGTAPTLAKCQTPAVHAGMQVRRLTPRECERLQGFPDDWTLIPWRTWQEAQRKGASYESLLAERGMRLREPAGEACPDSPRYKALGNSFAVPVVRWIGRRIDAACAAAKRSAA